MCANENVSLEQTNSDELEARCVHVSLKELARDFIIVGIKGKLLRVRRKSDGAELWLRVPMPLRRQ